MKTENLFDLTHTRAKELLADTVYPWEVLPKISEFIRALGSTLDSEKFVQVKEDVWIAKNAVVAESASVTGPCIIDELTEVRHCAFIRGGVLVGKSCVIGNSTEVKNSIIFDGVQIPHFNYVGDSVLGYKSHLGAGAVTSNVKSDKTPVTIKHGDKKIETNLKKVGAMVGDMTEVGCHSVLCPGTVIGKDSIIYPTSMVRGYIEEKSIFKRGDNVVKKQDNFKK